MKSKILGAICSFFFILSISSPVFAHGGGLDWRGCHHDYQNGGYHCHRTTNFEHQLNQQQMTEEKTDEEDPNDFQSFVCVLYVIVIILFLIVGFIKKEFLYVLKFVLIVTVVMELLTALGVYWFFVLVISLLFYIVHLVSMWKEK